MTESDLARAESKLGPLPPAYRRFLLEVPAAERREWLPHWYSTVGPLVRRNRGIRRHPEGLTVWHPDGREHPWPADWLLIGDADGERCVFLRPDARGVWEWDHETRAVEQVAKTFAGALTEARKRWKWHGPVAPPPAPEPFTHPTLGALLWHPDYRYWKGQTAAADGRAVSVTLSPPDPADRFGCLDRMAAALPGAVAAEPAVFAAERDAVLRDRLREWEPDRADALTDADIRAQLTWDGLLVSEGRTEFHLHYFYVGGELFDWDMWHVMAAGRLRNDTFTWSYL